MIYLDLQKFSVHVISLMIPSRLEIFQPARPAVHQSELDIFPGSTALYTSAAHTAHCLSGSSSVVPVKDEEQSISHTANISIVMLGISSVVQSTENEAMQSFLVLMLYGMQLWSVFNYKN